MKVIGVIPSRYGSTRIQGKPLADICGHPMIWWIYQQALKSSMIDELYVATDDERVLNVCEQYKMKSILTSKEHDTPTSRIYEVSKLVDGDLYVFISGDEPLIDAKIIDDVVNVALENSAPVTQAMTKIKTAPEVVDFSNIKVVTSTNGNLLYTTRSPLPYPKGCLDFDYMKFVGVGALSKVALQFYHDTPRSKLESIEECDLLRFIDKGITVKMVEVDCQSISVDTQKDLEIVRQILSTKNVTGGGGVFK